jgi:predicted nucleic-acid-binding protein
MDINTFSENLQVRIKLLSAMPEKDTLIARGKALGEMRSIINELKHFIHTYSFRNTKEEIQFFKEIKPVIASHYFYHKKLFSIAMFDAYRDRESRLKNYNTILFALERYARKHKDLYEYFMSGSTLLDRAYFTLEGNRISGINSDDKFTTGTDTVLSKFIAHQMIHAFILEAQAKLGNSDKSTLMWSESKVALVELIYALHSSHAIANGAEDIRTIVRTFEQLFSVDLGNYSRTFAEIQLRKSGQANFLDRMKTALITSIKNSDAR